MRINDRYASAINSSRLVSHPDTKWSDTDVLGAFAIADKRLSHGDGFSKHPLAVPLQRLFVGDKTAAMEITRILTEIIRGKALSMRINIAQTQAQDMARATLAWFRNPSCQVCGGHGFKIIKGTTTVGDSRCHPCAGSGKVLLEMGFRLEHRELLRYVMAKMDREAAMAGPEAMRALSPKLDLG